MQQIWQVWERLMRIVSGFFEVLIHEANLFTALADADPLGVNVNVTFDEIGGLDERK